MTDTRRRIRMQQQMVDGAVEATMKEYGIRPFSIVGGSRVAAIVRAVVIATIQALRQLDYPPVIERRTLLFTDDDWALDFDEESGEEAWWITLQLLDPEQRGHDIVDHLAELSLSDVEAERLIGHLQDMITTGRKRFS